MILSGGDKNKPSQPSGNSSEQQFQIRRADTQASQTAVEKKSLDDLHGAIKDLIELFDIASDLARRGEQVNIDLLAMRVAILCDVIREADPTISRPFKGDLEALMGHLNLLENTLLRERVQLALNVEAADRRQRAKLAYGRVLPSMSSPALPKLPDDQPDE